MSNRRRLKPGYAKRAAHVAEAVITAGMVEGWKQDPDTVPPEWRDFWADHGPRPYDVPDEPLPLLTQQEQEELYGMRAANALDGCSAAAEVLSNAEQSLAAHVAIARAEGRSWQAIADAIGMSKQGAAQKYGP